VESTADDTHRPTAVLGSCSAREGTPRRQGVLQLFETSARRFWVASSEGLLEFFPDRDDQGRWLHCYSERNGLSYPEITALNEDLGGNLWLGTDTGGAMKIPRYCVVSFDQRGGPFKINSIFFGRAGTGFFICGGCLAGP